MHIKKEVIYVYFENSGTVLTAAKSLAGLASQQNVVELVTPANLLEQKNKWIEASLRAGEPKGNPMFYYEIDTLAVVDAQRKHLPRLFKMIEDNVKFEDERDFPLREIYKNRKKEVTDTANIALAMLRGTGSDMELGGQFIRKYGMPSKTLVEKAYKLAKDLERYKETDISPIALELKEKKFNAEQISEFFKRVLEESGIYDWDCFVSDRVSSIDVRSRNVSKDKGIYIPTDRKVDGLKLLSLAGHEIGCHLLGIQNTQQLLLNLYLKGTPLEPLAPWFAKSDDETLHEGVAKMCDVFVMGNEGRPLPYATIAIDEASKGKSFEQVARTIFDLRLKNGASVEAAIKGSWLTTYRVFRGSRHTDNISNYAFTKDYAYLKGYDEVQADPDPFFLNYSGLTFKEAKNILASGIDLGREMIHYKEVVGTAVSILTKA